MTGRTARSRRPGSDAGRPLDPTRDAAIVHAALEGLAELGYDRLSMDEIAARARVGKGALYRRWASKAALIVDAVVAWREQLAPMTVPDTGSLAGDLDALAEEVPDFDDAAKRDIRLFVGLVTAAARDPELREALGATALERPRRVLREVLEHAAARGEIPPGRDLELVPDILIGLVQMRMTLGGELADRAYVRRVLREVVYPLVTAPAVEP